MSPHDIPPQSPGLAAKSIDELWQWHQGKTDARLAGEPLLDGWRCSLSKYSDDVWIKFDANEDLARQHPELTAAVRKAPFENLILDGVAVAVADGKVLSKDHLEALPTGEPGFPAVLLASDCLFLDEDLGPRPLGDRREILKAAVHDIDCPLIQLSPVREFSTRKELEIVNRWSVSRPGSEGLLIKDLSKPHQSGSSEDWAVLKTLSIKKETVPRLDIQVKGKPNPRAVFIAASPNEIEAARGVPLAGEGRRFFRKAYLEPAGLQEEDIAFLYLVPRVLKRAPTVREAEAWKPWLTKQLQNLNPELVVALGKQAGEALGELADLTIPHPHAILKHGDSGEVSRKTQLLKKSLTAQVLNNCKCKDGFAGKEIRCSIFKADEDRRLVYSVIAESDIADAQGDVMSGETIEEMAHNYMLDSRKHDERHDWRTVDAAPVESWVFRENTVLFGVPIKAISWVIGVKVLADHIWAKVKSGEYQAFSIGGRGVRVPRVRFE